MACMVGDPNERVRTRCTARNGAQCSPRTRDVLCVVGRPRAKSCTINARSQDWYAHGAFAYTCSHIIRSYYKLTTFHIWSSLSTRKRTRMRHALSDCCWLCHVYYERQRYESCSCDERSRGLTACECFCPGEKHRDECFVDGVF